MKTLACIIARTNSTRLQKKVLKEVKPGTLLIEYIIQKIKKAKNIDEIYLCTSADENDKVLLDIAKQNGIKGFAGSRNSVIDRMLDVAKTENVENVVRITGDNIFTDEVYLDLMIKHHLQHSSEYTRTEYLPLGVTPEIINVDALKKCKKQMNPDESQYLLLYMFQPQNFNCRVLIPEKKHQLPNMTLTVDTPEDFNRTIILTNQKKDGFLNLNEIIDICENQKVPNVEYKPGGAVRFPANLLFSYKAFRTEMEERTENSKKTFLKDGEYNKTLKSQNNV